MPDQNPIDELRHSRIRFVVIAACLIAGAALLANLLLLFQEGAWQMLVMVIVEAVTIVIMLIAYRIAFQNKLDSAGILALISVFLGFAAGELVHRGLTIYLMIGGTLLLVLVGNLFFQHRRYEWFAFPIIYLVYFWLVNRFEPLPRYNILNLTTFRSFIAIIIVLAILLGILQFIRVLRFGSVRARLLTVIISMALVPAVLIISLATAFSVQRSILQTQYQLGSIADLKMNQVKAWFDSLETNIRLAVPSIDQVGFTEMLLKEPQESEQEFYQVIYQREKTRYQQVMAQSRVFTEIFLVDLSGKVIVSTDTSHEARIEYGYDYFTMGLNDGGITVPFLYPYTDKLSILIVAPITNTSGEKIAMLAAQANLANLDEIMLERAGLGERGASYLINDNTLQLITQTDIGRGKFGDYIYSLGISRAAEYQMNGQNRYDDPWNTPVIGAYRHLPEKGLSLLSELPEDEALSPVYQNIIFNVLLTIGIVIVAILIALRVANMITRPIADLASTAERISAGDLDLVARIDQSDEIGTLAGAFNRMTAQLRRTLTGLEEQVAERTATLEQRTNYLQASADISRAVASVLDPDQLIRDVVDLIHDRFELYYVGLFLLDNQNEYAVLRAGTGAAGQAMLARQHRIKVGSGMIGWSVANRTSRIAQRAELDASRLANPDLPDTRSEAAVPLVSRGEVIGALTIQSTLQDVFDSATISVFETMADQVAVALDNARLYVQSQQTLESLRSLYGEITVEGWRKLLNENPQLGYRSELGVPLSQELDWSPELVTTYDTGKVAHGKLGNGNHPKEFDRDKQREDAYYLGIPLKVREQIIGVLGCYKSTERGDWSPDEIVFMQEVGQTISVALESARFFNETQLRAENERLIAEVTGQLRQTLDIDTVLTTAVREIQRILGLAEVEIRMSSEVEA
jgi:GAF domain-containing protein/HAMP domain-containing protein